MWHSRLPRKTSQSKAPSRGASYFESLESRRLLSAVSNVVLHNDLQILKNSASSSNIQGYTPSQISQAYNFNNISFSNGAVKGDGSGQTIAIVDAFNAPNITHDLGVFDSQFGLAAPPSFKVVNGNGGSNLPTTDAGWAGEISLDVEWAHAIAPGANIVLVEAASASLTDLLKAVDTARNMAGVSVVSMSWGGSEFFSFNGAEFTGETQYDYHFTTPAGHTGVTFVASAGDSGVFSGVEWPAVSPNVVSVGGTSLYANADGSYAGEYSWSGTSGGVSQVEPTPAYQQSADPYTTRTSPDVAYVGDPNTGVAVYDSLADGGYVGWQVVGGTSVGAPQWAALIAIADQGRAVSGLSTLDGASQTLPVLYSLYGAPGTSAYSSYTTDFNDVIDPGRGRFFGGAATAGYDTITGLGSPIASQIVDALANITPGSSTPTTPTSPTTPTLPASFIDATIVSKQPSSVVGSTRGSVTLRLLNTASLAFDGPISVSLYAVTGSSIPANASAFATVTINNVKIAAGGTTTEVVHFQYPTSIPDGAYHVAAGVTATGTNTAAADVVSADAVTIDAPSVDLSGKGYRSVVGLAAGHERTIAVRITNSGNITANGTYTLALYSSSDDKLDSSDPLITDITAKLLLKAGHSMLAYLTFQVPASLAPGSYNLIAAVSSSTRPPDVNTSDKDVLIGTKA
jgi:subtilase family serine protease